MSSFHDSVRARAGSRGRLAALVVGALLLSGCGGMIGRLPLVGEANAPPPPEIRPDYPSIGAKDAGATKPMTPAEKGKIEAELAAARLWSVPVRRQAIAAPTAPAAPAAP